MKLKKYLALTSLGALAAMWMPVANAQDFSARIRRTLPLIQDAE